MLVPISFRKEIAQLSSESIQKDIIDMFSMNVTQGITKKSVIKLFHSLYQLESISINFNIAAVIYEWRMMDNQKNHGTVAVFAGSYAWNKMIDDLLMNFDMGYNSSCIQRFRVSEIKKPRFASRRSRNNKQSRFEYVFNVTAICGDSARLEALSLWDPDHAQKTDDVTILSMNDSSQTEITKRIMTELNDDSNALVIVAINHLPIKLSQITGSCKRHSVFTELDITFHRSLSVINIIMKKVNFTAFEETDKQILITAINSDLFHLTVLDKKIFESILKSMNTTNSEIYDQFCTLVKLQYLTMKIENQYKEWFVSTDLITPQMVNIMLDFLENTVKMLLINKEFELNQILSDSDYIQSGFVPKGLDTNKIDLKMFFGELRGLMIKIRSGDAEVKKVWSSFEALQFGIRVRKAALTIGKILCERKLSECAGVVRIVCDPVITELVHIVVTKIGCNVLLVDTFA